MCCGWLVGGLVLGLGFFGGLGVGWVLGCLGGGYLCGHGGCSVSLWRVCFVE